MSATVRLIVEITPEQFAWLGAILAVSDRHDAEDTVADLVETLVQAACDGARRRSANERFWLQQVVPLREEPGIPDPELPNYYRALPPGLVEAVVAASKEPT